MAYGGSVHKLQVAFLGAVLGASCALAGEAAIQRACGPYHVPGWPRACVVASGLGHVRAMAARGNLRYSAFYLAEAWANLRGMDDETNDPVTSALVDIGRALPIGEPVRVEYGATYCRPVYIEQP
jgi:hypothetical protein